MADSKIRVLIIDDSAIARNTLTRILETDSKIEVVGTAPDALIGLKKIRQLQPDVLTLDVEMPRMDGLSFLERLMSSQPMPVVMVSAHTGEGSEAALKALELGAVEIVEKPRIEVNKRLQEIALEITEKVKAAAIARLKNPQQRFQELVVPHKASRSLVPEVLWTNSPQIIAIGASTGGTEVIREILSDLPAEMPGIHITQHMPKAFTSSFAKSLDRSAKIAVKEGEHRERLRPGLALLAPGEIHMRLQKDKVGFYVSLDDDPPINRHRPSIDALFGSVASAVGENSIGVLLTGMGGDGALGMQAMHRKGAWTIAQEESTCVVYGMPRVAVELNAVNEVLKPEQIVDRLASVCLQR